jgi:hypothetical protein
LPLILSADIKSNEGLIRFDVDGISPHEAQLDGTGLKIGSSAASANLEVDGNALISSSLSVGGTNQSGSNLHIQGGLEMSLHMVSSNTILNQASVVLVDTSGGNLVLDMPYAGNVQGRFCSIKKTTHESDLFIRYRSGNRYEVIRLLESDSSSVKPYLKLFSDGLTWHTLQGSGESSSWQPSSSANSLGIWLDAADENSFSFSGSGNVEQWDDKSGNENHLSQADNNLQPTRSNDTLIIGGYHYLQKDTQVNMLSANGKHTVFLVMKLRSVSGETGSYRIIANMSTEAQPDERRPIFFLWAPSDQINHSYNSNGGATMDLSTFNETHIVMGERDNSTTYLFLDGEQENTVAGISQKSSTTANYFRVGHSGDRSQDIEINEVILFPDQIDINDRRRIEGYLAWKWSLVGLLDDSHPYKVFPPRD